MYIQIFGAGFDEFPHDFVVIILVKKRRYNNFFIGIIGLSIGSLTFPSATGINFLSLSIIPGMLRSIESLYSFSDVNA